MRIRKQYYELTNDDLTKFPIWEHCHGHQEEEESPDYQDEATVRPVTVSGPLDGTTGWFLVRATFTLADGSKMIGFFHPGSDDVPYQEPTIVTDGEQVMFNGANPDWLAGFYELLGRNAAAVFPLRYQSDVELVGGRTRHELAGFKTRSGIIQ